MPYRIRIHLFGLFMMVTAGIFGQEGMSNAERRKDEAAIREYLYPYDINQSPAGTYKEKDFV